MTAPVCIRAPRGAPDALSLAQVERYLSLLSPGDRRVVCSPSFDEAAREHFDALGVQRCADERLAIAICAALQHSERLRDAVQLELSQGSALKFVLEAHLSAAADGGVDRDQFPAFVRFCLAYRIHCYFETSRLAPGKDIGVGSASAAAIATEQPQEGRPQVVFVLGGPGSGKGTQCTRIAQTYGYSHLSAGDLLREERSQPGSKYGELIENCIKSGSLVPADITVALLEQAMRRQGWEKGKYLVDGFPRSQDNFDAWNLVVGSKAEVKFTLFFDCSEACMEARLLERGKTSGRSDDNAETIRKRFHTFRDESLPVVTQLESAGQLRRISAEQSVEEVWRDVQAVFAPSVVFVLGGPGSGKGTACVRIAESFGYTHLSAGDLLRAERSRPGSDLGEMIENCIRNGSLVPAEITVQLLLRAMEKNVWEGGKYLIDGFPRSADNLKAWEDTVGGKVVLKFCLYLDCSEGMMEQRLLERGKSSGRSDDNLESIRKRLIVFRSESLPVVEQFASQCLLRRIDAQQTKEQVWTEVQALFGPSVVFVLGGPGAGKGTQCTKIVDLFGYKHLSAGDLLRAERSRAGSTLGELIENYIREGKLVPVDITVTLLVNAMEKQGWEGGRYLIDGFPRSFDNLDGWNRVVGKKAQVRFALFFDCSEEALEARLLERGKTSGRADDNMESIRKRFATFRLESMPVVEELKRQGKLRRIDSAQSVDRVWAEVRKVFAPSVVFILGGPGAGKGTQCSRISPSFGYHHLSAGDLLREESAKTGSELGTLILDHIKNGKLVPVEIVVELLRAAMEKRGWEGGKYLIDGFPRSLDNLEGWMKALGDKVNLRFTLFLECTESVMLQRLTQRSKTSGRADDNEETIRKRFRTFVDETLPVAERFERDGVLRRVDAECGPDGVWHCIQEIMHNEIDIHIRNQALVFLKPHACNFSTARFVQSYLTTRNVAILSKGMITGEDLAATDYFGRQYPNLARHAEIDPSSLQLPEAALTCFRDAFSIQWSAALAAGQVLSAKSALDKLSMDHLQLSQAFRSAVVAKLTPHIQVGRIGADGGAVHYVINGFVPHLRHTFLTGTCGVRYFVVEFDPADLSWSRFRHDVIGATNPEKAATDSIRAQMHREWQALGLTEQPDTLNNCVHASAGPLEGLRERMLWAGTEFQDDLCGRLLLSSGVPTEVLESWLDNPTLEEWPTAGDTSGSSLFERSVDVDTGVFRDAAVTYLKQQQESGAEGLRMWSICTPGAQRDHAGAASPMLSPQSSQPAESRSTKPPPDRMTIIHFNDVYNVEPRVKEPVGGLSRFVTRVRELKAEGVARGEPEPIVLFSGDAFNPSLTSTVTMGEHMVTALNFVGINTACYGNHDFDFGVDQLVKMAAQNNFPWLISNVSDKATGRPLAEGRPTRLLDYHGRKIGLIGLVEIEWLVTLATINPEDVEYEDFCTCARRLTKQLKTQDGAEIVIALTHMRVPNDELLAHSVAEVDIILGGHDHHYDVKPVGPHGTYILKSGTDFRDITSLQVEFLSSPDAQGRNFRVVSNEHSEIVGSIAEDPEVKLFVDECVGKVGDAMDQTIGESAVELDSRFASIRTQETNVGNFVTDIMRKSLGADIGFLNSGTLRADAMIESGAFKMRDLVNLLPMLDELCLLQLSGEQLMSVLENSVSQYPRLEGRFAQVSGLNFTFDAAKPSGSRIVPGSIKIGSQDLEMERKYKLCTKDYLRQGKDGYDAFKEAICLADGEQAGILPSLVRDFFQSLSTLNGESDDAQKASAERASKMLAEGELARVGEGPDPLRRFAIQPKVEGRIVCLNPVAT